MKKSFAIKSIALAVVVLLLTTCMIGCGKNNSGVNSNSSKSNSSSSVDKNNSASSEVELKSEPQADVVASAENLPIVTMNVKNYGTMTFELYPSVAPNTVNNFISLINKGLYNNLTFHRIISNFMVQGGDPKGDGTGGPDYSIKGEFAQNKIENKLKHKVGVLSMARSQSNDSAGSQFFIMTKDTPSLDGQYAAFGRIISGLDVLTKIKNVKTGSNDKTVDKVIIESVTVDTKGVEYKEPETLPRK